MSMDSEFCTMCGMLHEVGRHTAPAPGVSVVNIQNAGERAKAAADAFVEDKGTKPRTLGDWLAELLVTIFLIIFVPPTLVTVAFAVGAMFLGGWLALLSVANSISAATCEPLSLWCWTPGQSLFVTMFMVVGLLMAGALVVDLAKTTWRNLHTLPGQRWPPTPPTPPTPDKKA